MTTKPEQDGFYWLYIKNEKPTIVKIYDFDIDDPTVAVNDLP